MRTPLIIACAALFPAACSPSDSPSLGLEAAEYTRQPAQFSISTTAGAPLGPPNLAVARAAEAASLQELETHLHPEDRDEIIASLASDGPEPVVPPEKKSGHYFYGFRSKSPELTVYTRFFAARAHRQAEERRASSVAHARQRGSIDVVVALGAPPAGDEALVLRRPVTAPLDVIVLGPASSGEVLGGALATIDQNREEYGDDLESDVTIGLRDAHATNVDAVFARELDDLVARLRTAPLREIAGVGNVRAIDLPAIELGAITASAARR